MSLWFWSCRISWCGYVSGGYISFIDVKVTTAKIKGDYSLVGVSFSVLVTVVVAVTVSVVVVVIIRFCGLVIVVGNSSIASSVTVSGYVMGNISLSNLSIVRLGNLERNGSVMITVIVSSWKLWIKGVIFHGRTLVW